MNDSITISLILDNTQSEQISPEEIEKKTTKKETKKNHQLFSFSMIPISSHLWNAIITVPSEITEIVYTQIIKLFKQKNFSGLQAKDILDEYIEENFKNEISKKVKNYLFNHLVIDFLMNEILAKKIPLSNYPRLKKIEITQTKNALFTFDLSLADPLELKEWKHFLFKAPKRKRYKDLDKQVEQFIEQETTASKKQKDHIEDSDWVYFQATLLNNNQQALSQILSSTHWIKIKNEEVIDSLKELFLCKKLQESFITNNLHLDGTGNNNGEDYQLNFLITILDIVKGTHLSLEYLKIMFKRKNKLEVHNKLMEIFSYRNDQSQRKAIIEEFFHLFLSKHRFEIPKHLILRRQEDILLTLTQQPDYQVYKAQKDFITHVELLAEKQLKEEILIDQVAYKEEITVDLQDVHHYLHLFNNKRLREFVYFKPLLEKIDQVNIPINASILNQAVLREKTLNHMIYTLTR